MAGSVAGDDNWRGCAASSPAVTEDDIGMGDTCGVAVGMILTAASGRLDSTSLLSLVVKRG